MKKIMLMLMTIALLLTFSSCGGEIKENQKSNNSDNQIETTDDSTQPSSHSDELKTTEMLGYSFVYPSTYNTYSSTEGDVIATDHVRILVIFSSYGTTSRIDRDSLMHYEESLCSNIGRTFKKYKANKQIIENYESGTVNGFDYAKATGKLCYSIDDSQFEYTAYYVLTEDNKLIYWVGVAESGYESELASTMEIMKDNFKKAE